jgi:hypothetical protein
VLTSQYDIRRSGFNGFETTLTPGASGTVHNMNTSGKTVLTLSSTDVPPGYRENPIYAQPLYVPGISIGGTTHNILVVATLNDTIYTFDTAGNPPSSTPLWSRQGTSQPVGDNALWYDDCQSGGGPIFPPQTPASLPFWGILSTPVIDLTVAGSNSTPVMFVVSHCVTSQGQKHVYINEIDLVTGKDVVLNGNRQFKDVGSDLGSGFDPGRQKQRAALLEVKNSGAATPNLIYAPFGTATVENDALNHPYHGWLAAYTVSSSYVLSFASNFAYNSTSTACTNGQYGGIQGQQCTTNGGTPACDCYLACPISGDTCNNSTGMCTNHPTTACFQNVPNWGGQGGGCFMFGRGMAATGVGEVGSDGDVHSFLACGNGGFQYTNLTSSPTNAGESVLDFRLTGKGFDTAPFQSFTPNGSDSSVIVKPQRPSNACNCVQQGGSYVCSDCTTTLQALNIYDWDQGSCGLTLFNDLSGNIRLLTCDKAGYGYLMTPGNLCGTGSNSQCVGWSSTDSSVSPFGMSLNLCDNLANPVASNCDRITSMALYSTIPSSSSSSAFVYFWPNSERLTAYQLSDDTTAVSGGTQQISWNSSTPTIIQMTGCTVGTNCPSSYFVPGDVIIPTTGCTCSGSNCPVVTGVADDSTTAICGTAAPCATINHAFPASCSSPQAFQYKGYFLNPRRDNVPAPDRTGYPGGSVILTAQWDTSLNPHQYDNGVVWELEPGDSANEFQRAKGTLRAYTAITDPQSQLPLLWTSSDVFCLSSFALPTIAKGRIYVPTYSIPTSGTGICPKTGDQTTYENGILVYYP